MANIILKRYSIPVTVYWGTINLYFYYTKEGTTPDLVGNFSYSAELPSAAQSGKTVAGYKLIINSLTVAQFKEGPIYSQVAYGSGSTSTDSSVTTTLEQYESKARIFYGSGQQGSYQTKDLVEEIKASIASGKAISIEAIYIDVPLRININSAGGIKQVVYNTFDCNVFKTFKNDFPINLFSKTSVTFQYISNVSLSTTNFPTCTVQTVTGVNNLLMPNYKINKFALPKSVQYSNSIAGMFERIEPEEIRVWKDQICQPTSEVRSTTMIIPQKSRFINLIKAYRNTDANSSTTTTDLGIKDKMVQFDRSISYEIPDERMFAMTGGLQADFSYHAIYPSFQVAFKNTDHSLNGYELYVAFKVRGLVEGPKSVSVILRTMSSTKTVLETKEINISNNQYHQVKFPLSNTSQPLEVLVKPNTNVGSTTKLAFCPFYIKELGGLPQV